MRHSLGRASPGIRSCVPTAPLGSPASAPTLASVLDELVESGREAGGALAVVRDGVVAVDHRAGTRDGVEPWEADTLVMTYSVAKPFAALAFLDAVAGGAVGLDQAVAAVWPDVRSRRQGDDHDAPPALAPGGPAAFPPEAAHVAFDDREALVALLARGASPSTHLALGSPSMP